MSSHTKRILDDIFHGVAFIIVALCGSIATLVIIGALAHVVCHLILLGWTV